jgi:VanZ family protein
VSAPAATVPSWRSPRARVAWLLVVAWLAVIFTFSSDLFAAPSTESWVRPLLVWLFPDWTAAEIWRLHYAIRKSAHPGVYAVLALLAFRALRLSFARSALWHAALALLLVLGVALSDELRQSRSRARTGSPVDVGYDLAGGSGALALRQLLASLFRRGRRPAGEV